MTCGEALYTIQTLIIKDSLTEEDCESLAYLTIDFCRAYNYKWSLEIRKTMNQVLRKSIEMGASPSTETYGTWIQNAICSAKGNLA